MKGKTIQTPMIFAKYRVEIDLSAAELKIFQKYFEHNEIDKILVNKNLLDEKDVDDFADAMITILRNIKR